MDKHPTDRGPSEQTAASSPIAIAEALGITVTRLLGRDLSFADAGLVRLARDQHVIVALGVPNNRASDCHLHILGQISQQAYRVIHEVAGHVLSVPCALCASDRRPKGRDPRLGPRERGAANRQAPRKCLQRRFTPKDNDLASCGRTYRTQSELNPTVSRSHQRRQHSLSRATS